MRLAEWSGKAAVEDQDNVRFSSKIGQIHDLTAEVSQAEIRSGGVERYSWHDFIPFFFLLYGALPARQKIID